MPLSSLLNPKTSRAFYRIPRNMPPRLHCALKDDFRTQTFCRLFCFIKDPPEIADQAILLLEEFASVKIFFILLCDEMSIKV